MICLAATDFRDCDRRMRLAFSRCTCEAQVFAALTCERSIQFSYPIKQRGPFVLPGPIGPRKSWQPTMKYWAESPNDLALGGGRGFEPLDRTGVDCLENVELWFNVDY